VTATGTVASVALRDPVFISDLHLTQEQPRTVQRFLRLVEQLGASGRELVILGDLFEYWAGDDEVGNGIGATVGAALHSLSSGGTPVYLMRGNRDVLLGDGFAKASGAALLPDPVCTVLGGVSTLLSHGDAYCTLDVAYQAFRRQVRDPLWQREFLSRPLAERRGIIGQVRQHSDASKKILAAQIMDVTPEAIEEALRSSAAHRMIHGHTHRPDRHRLSVDGQSAERWVLPDWDFEMDPGRGGYLHLTGDQLEVIDLA
jgi:UDP-2,3-diacylglucosamine hydrolase